MKQTYLVTGAAGFIGSHLCQTILTKYPQSTIIGIDDINAYYNKEINLRRIRELSKNKRFQFYKTSILDNRKICTICKSHKPSTLIHTAAQVGVRNGELHPSLYFSTNVSGTINILGASAPYISHAIIFSSSSVYGSTKILPFRESQPISVSTPLSVYGASKASMETYVHAIYKKMNFPISIVRPFSIYGPDGRPDMLPMKLLISAKQSIPIDVYEPEKLYRDWTYIDDCIHWIMDIENHPNGLQTINIGGGNPIRLDTILDIAKRTIEPYGYSLSLRIKPANAMEMVKTWADTKTLNKITGITKPIDFNEGFKRTADYFFSKQTSI